MQTYLSARQWLEHYASTHAEMSPMDEKAYLPAGRKMFYYYQYRRDMILRSELSRHALNHLRHIPQQRRKAARGSSQAQTMPWGVLPGALQSSPRGLKPELALQLWLHSWRLGG